MPDRERGAILPLLATLYSGLLSGDVPTLRQLLAGALAMGGVVLVFSTRQQEQ